MLIPRYEGRNGESSLIFEKRIRREMDFTNGSWECLDEVLEGFFFLKRHTLLIEFFLIATKKVT